MGAVSHERTRSGRAVFLGISAAFVVVVLGLAHQVVLPFILALVVAYVLTPAVERLERLRFPRWAAVITVYAVSLGSLYLGAAAAAPRFGAEVRALSQELPRIAAQARDEHVPALRRWMTRFAPTPTDAAQESSDNDGPRIVPRPDGSYDVDLGTGFEIETVGEGRWRVIEAPPVRGSPFDLGHVVTQALAHAAVYVQHNTLQALRLGQVIVGTISRAIFLFFMTLMLAAYMMITRERIVGFFRNLVYPGARLSFDVLLARIDQGLSGVVRGQLIICAVNGVLSAIGFCFFGLKYWPILALVAAVMSIVPIFGSICSSVPIVAVALTQSFGTAVAVLLWILGIHQLEANFLNPKIIGDAARIHPVLVVFALLAGEHLFGITGALLAVPTLSIVQSLFLHFRQVTYRAEAPPDSFWPVRVEAPAPPRPARGGAEAAELANAAGERKG